MSEQNPNKARLKAVIAFRYPTLEITVSEDEMRLLCSKESFTLRMMCTKAGSSVNISLRNDNPAAFFGFYDEMKSLNVDVSPKDYKRYLDPSMKVRIRSKRHVALFSVIDIKPDHLFGDMEPLPEGRFEDSREHPS